VIAIGIYDVEEVRSADVEIIEIIIK